MDCLRDRMVQDIDGELVFDEELLYDYMTKDTKDLSDEEKAVLLEVIAMLKDTVAVYETIATIGIENLDADVLNYIAWLSDSEKYESFTAVSVHYNDIYVDLLNYISLQGEGKLGNLNEYLKKKLKDNDLYDEEEDTRYFDSDGNEI